MAAMFSAAAQAPFVAITILLEICGHYHLTAPVMAAAAVSYFIYGCFTRDCIYTVKLRRRGIAVLRRNDVRPLEQIAVQAAMAEDVPPAVSARDNVDAVYDRLMHLHRSFLPVTDDGGQLIGLVTLTSLATNHAANQGSRPVSEVMTPPPTPIWATDSLDTALRRFALEDAVALPVRGGPRGDVAGWVTRDEVIRAYNASTLRTLGTAQQVHALAAAGSDPGRFFEVVLPERSPLVGRLLQDVRLPKSALVVSLVRNNARIIPHGHTALERGDRLLVYVAPANEAETVRAVLERGDGVEEPTSAGPVAPRG
jgi:CBS domain-containing protein